MNFYIKNLKEEIVPLIFGIFITVSFMYNYDNNLVLLFLAISIFMQSLIYLFYDYISTKGRIMQYISILGSFAVLFLLVILFINISGGIFDFFLWFISTQDVVSYSFNYVMILLLGLNIFIGSTVYYFTRVRYRMLVTFLLMLIPISIFAKENQTMPIRFLLPLIVLYFATLIVCGQNNLYDNEKIQVIQNKSYFKSVGSFILGFILIVSLAPKPTIKANRDVFESLITANSLTDYLLSQLSGFTDTSNGSGISFSSTRKLYEIETSETLSVKSRTFSDYNFQNDVWLRADGVQSKVEKQSIDTNLYFGDIQDSIVNYDRYGTPLENNSIDTFKQSLNPTELLNAIVYAVSSDENFAKKYNLEDIPKDTHFNDCTKSIKVKSVTFVTTFILNPTNTYRVENISNGENRLSSTYSGIILPTNESSYIPTNSEFSLDYYSKSLIRQNFARDILTKLNFEDYGILLEDLSIIVDGTNYQDVVKAYIQDYKNTITYSKIFTDCDSENILNLAESITKDCNSDLEKAEALENYFISNGFEYDTNFKREKGETIEEFLFNYKTGACYEYSTSMILMARAIGLPARYVEGFLVDNPTGKTSVIDVTASSSHAYPEIYISGFGWCYFEPTQTYTISEEEDSITLSQNIILIVTSISLCALVILAWLFMMFIYPKIYENYFRKKVLKVSPNDSMNLIIKRIKKLCKISNSQTLEETQQSILSSYKFDIQNLVDISNQIFYSDLIITTDVVKNLLGEYIELYNIIIDVNKEVKKQKRKSKRKKK